MTVLSAQTILTMNLLTPLLRRAQDELGNSYGLGPCGYDLRIAETVEMRPGDFRLVSAMEEFDLPSNVVAFVHDKSTWARRGLAVQNTVAEPGWRGFLTLELTNHGVECLRVPAGCAIAQAVFHFLDEPTGMPYSGKYQDQQSGPQGPR